LEILKKSLELYLETVTDETDRTEIIDSISEINKQLEIDEPTYLISFSDLTDLLISKTYDEFGKLKKSTGTVTLEQYTEIVRNKYYLDIVDSQIEIGYSIINDLWNDNERYGNNNPDGTFKK
jgi:hypothetical protein